MDDLIFKKLPFHREQRVAQMFRVHDSPQGA
jgi:hypothetical protein